MKASIVDANDEFAHAFDQLKAAVLPTNQVAQVSTSKPYPSPGTGPEYRRDRFWLETQHSKRTFSTKL